MCSAWLGVETVPDQPGRLAPAATDKKCRARGFHRRGDDAGLIGAEPPLPLVAVRLVGEEALQLGAQLVGRGQDAVGESDLGRGGRRVVLLLDGGDQRL